MSLRTTLKTALITIGLIGAPVTPLANNALIAERVTPAAAPAKAAPTLSGIASYYGTPKDRFGYVDRDDPLVQDLLRKNGVRVEQMPVRFIAAVALTDSQMEALHRVNPNKYRLITASGESLNPKAMIAAMDKQYLGKYVEVTNRDNGRTVVVKIIDTGSFQEKYGRVIDLSAAAAEEIGITTGGLANVDIRVLEG